MSSRTRPARLVRGRPDQRLVRGFVDGRRDLAMGSCSSSTKVINRRRQHGFAGGPPCAALINWNWPFWPALISLVLGALIGTVIGLWLCGDSSCRGRYPRRNGRARPASCCTASHCRMSTAIKPRFRSRPLSAPQDVFGLNVTGFDLQIWWSRDR